jgi:hypothetical protein
LIVPRGWSLPDPKINIILVPKLLLGNLAIPQTMVFITPGAAWRWPQASAAKLELGNEVELPGSQAGAWQRV